MKPNEVYVDLDGAEIRLADLEPAEQGLIARLRRRAHTHPDWTDFDNYWMRVVADFFDTRGWSRKESRQTAAYRVAQDLSSRLGIAAGMIRPPDYRDELEELIRKKFSSRREFCKATGLSEDMLSHVLAGRKDLSLPTLTQALGRIGYGLRLAPLTKSGKRKRTG